MTGGGVSQASDHPLLPAARAGRFNCFVLSGRAKRFSLVFSRRNDPQPKKASSECHAMGFIFQESCSSSLLEDPTWCPCGKRKRLLPTSHSIEFWHNPWDARRFRCGVSRLERWQVWDKDVFGSNTHVAGCRFPMSAATLSRTPAARVPTPAWHNVRAGAKNCRLLGTQGVCIIDRLPGRGERLTSGAIIGLMLLP